MPFMWVLLIFWPHASHALVQFSSCYCPCLHNQSFLFHNQFFHSSPWGYCLKIGNDTLKFDYGSPNLQSLFPKLWHSTLWLLYSCHFLWLIYQAIKIDIVFAIFHSIFLFVDRLPRLSYFHSIFNVPTHTLLNIHYYHNVLTSTIVHCLFFQNSTILLTLSYFR